ncbi:MAG: endo-1,4-beta-xylanase [Planctomycetota bacterium]
MNHDVVDVLGETSMIDWFKQAHAADPQAKLYINDYGILTAGGSDETHQSAYENTIRYLLENDTPIHGIGMQGHFGQTLTPPAKLLEVLDRYTALGLSIKVTEFDISTDDEQMQAAYARDFLTVMYSHPAVEAVVMWGFWENRHWRPNAAWWREDWSPKPAVAAFQSLFNDQWRTQAEGKTDSRGRFFVRGHLGDYTITVVDEEGRRAEHQAELAITGSEVIVEVR